MKAKFPDYLKHVPKFPITVFTPTFNRAYCLGNAYQSLLRQSCKDFEWLIIDDGSTDNTRELVESWQAEGLLSIRYIYKENGGMHSAHNVAHANVATELCMCLDSDDQLTDDCVEVVLAFWRENADCHEQVAGIIADDGQMDGSILGTPLPQDIRMEKEEYLHQILGVKGDKKLIFRTSVANSVPPYPEFPGEKFGSMGFKTRHIEMTYPWLILPRIVYLVEYMPDGATHNMYKMYRHSFRGWDVDRKLSMQYAITFKRRWMAAIHYVSNSIFMYKWNFVQDSPRRLLTMLAIPFGILLNLFIRFKTRN